MRKTESVARFRSLIKEKKRLRKSAAGIAVATTVMGGEDCAKRSVFIKAIQKRDNDGKSTAAQYVRAEAAVLRAEYEQRYEDPKGRVTLRKASHKI